ncbi:MAG: hypothetical protein R3246_14330 [Acidimicrobiia bacterium]|nr:hypothetical protein [Acidimicrobiia bacterium]
MADPIAAETPNPGHTDHVYDASMTLTVSGAEELGPLTVEVELRVVEIFAGRHPREVWFYSVSPNRPVPLPDERLMLFSADLSPGIWNGPGTYQLSDEAGVVLEGQPGVRSGAYIQLYGTADQETFARYDEFGAPCTLTVEPDDRSGSVSCPSLLDADGAEVDLDWSWERR